MSTNGTGAKPAQRPAARPAKASPKAGHNSGMQRGNTNKPLVRPAPRSKVRRARLVVAKVDTWTIAKLAFLLSVAMGIVSVVSAVILWLVMQATGAFDSLNELLTMLGTTGNQIDISEYLSLGQVALYTTVVAVVDVVLFTILGVIAGLLYNVAAKLVGGIGVTLTDD